MDALQVLPPALRAEWFTFAGLGFLSTDALEVGRAWRRLEALADAREDAQALASLETEELEKEHVRLFLAPQGAPLPPWQSAQGPGARLMGESHHSALGWFRRYGIEPARPNEPADHVGLLLSFYGHLLTIQAEDAEEFRAQHLSWVPAFCQELKRHTSLPFYRWLAGLTISLLQGGDAAGGV
ncbi:MAG: molecular chaperone TorD family protein [Bryobacteraceae bacterium]|nr:molecular chaperone TorD family protein [Bryobacteraceae bacterium]MDW8379914.1 molecular chaperone TorD family protein [Bryobacterales bacterium]